MSPFRPSVTIMVRTSASRRPKLIFCLVSGVVLLSVFPVPTASAASPVTASPNLVFEPLRETGKVVRVSDGDTIQVDIKGDGTTKPVPVRLTGINAMEIGECSAAMATKRLRSYVDGKTVRLRSADARSNASGRLLRQVQVKDAEGRWFDVNHRMLRDGMALWFPLKPELTNVHPYHLAAEQARSAGRGIWKNDRCGSGPNQGSTFGMWVKSDADGTDSKNLNDEYVVLTNRNRSTDVRLDGWWLRDSSLFTYRFPRGTVLKAGQRITVRVGAGQDTTTVKHMGRTKPLFDNADLRTGLGDGAYLFDPHGDLRVSFVYPYVGSGADPLAGAVRIAEVVYDPPGADTAAGERVVLQNVGQRRVNLDAYQLRSWPYAHAFRPGTYLDPGERLTVVIGRGSGTRTDQYWGKTAPILNNGGDVVELASWDERRVACTAWGTARC
jgi:endonuclease YncB( thermonuclease family)